MGSKTIHTIILSVSILGCLFSGYFIVYCLNQLVTTVDPEIYLNRIALSFFFLFFPLICSWYVFRLIGGLCVGLFLLTLIIFVISASNTHHFLWFLPSYTGLIIILHRIDQYFSIQIAMLSSEREKYQIEKNDHMSTYKSKGETISALFEKYSTYYNMRKLAEELAGTFDIHQIADIVVNRSLDFILRGNVCAISLFDSDSKKLPVIGYREIEPIQKQKNKHRRETDFFDFWVVKNRRQLIVMNSQEDFRFDAGETANLPEIKSLIIAPLIQEGRIMGTLRIHSPKANTFTHDDLRLLDTIAILAASALANALLFAQTEELAIKDSLTGLYVRRYFFDRLREEHRRSAMAKKNLSVLMCDLDHFKQCNDRYGHGVGDLMLVQLSKILKSFYESALVGRYGGEEFIVLMPEIDKKTAYAIAENLRLEVEKTPLLIRREEIRMTVSIGVACFPDDAIDVESLIEKADQGLYQAKRKGRNQVC